MNTPPVLFGTDGVRGQAGRPPFTPESLSRLGAALGRLLHSQRDAFQRRRTRNGKHTGRPLVLIGGDTRESRSMVLSALASGLLLEGIDVMDAGTLPTPAVAAVAVARGADAGIVISASHNPYHDNGIKLFGRDGYKIPDTLERAIEHEAAQIQFAPGNGSAMGELCLAPAAQDYVESVVRRFKKRLRLRGLRVVLDCANGATHYVAPAIFRRLGAHVFVLHDRPDGKNINLDCGALRPELLVRPVLRHKAHIGFSFDGDGDRVIAVDDKGHVRDGDFLLAVLARHLQHRGALHKHTVVTTVMGNLGLELAAKAFGIKLLRTPVGDKYVAETMLGKGFTLGGEQSGHLILSNETTTGDGIVSALCLLEAMQHAKQPLSSLAEIMSKCPQVLLNVPVREKKPFEKIPGFNDTMRSIEKALGRDGRVLLRYSGTENLARIMLEGKDLREIKSLAQRMAGVLAEHLGA